MTYVPILEALSWIAGKFNVSRVKNRGSILIVEDNPMDVELMRIYFRQCGREISVATTAEAAMVFIERNHLSMVLIDMNLPFLPGWKLVPILWERSPDTHVVITATQLIDILKIPSPDGFFSICLKPLSVSKVKHMLGMIDAKER